MKMTNGTMVVLALLEVGCIFGIGYMYDWRAGVATLLGGMVVRIAKIDMH
jgi:hypothetical protein